MFKKNIKYQKLKNNHQINKINNNKIKQINFRNKIVNKDKQKNQKKQKKKIII